MIIMTNIMIIIMIIMTNIIMIIMTNIMIIIMIIIIMYIIHEYLSYSCLGDNHEIFLVQNDFTLSIILL
jgi:hypothetical protein